MLLLLEVVLIGIDAGGGVATELVGSVRESRSSKSEESAYDYIYDAKSAHLIFPRCPFSPPRFPSSPPRFPSFSPRFPSFPPRFSLPRCVIIYIMYDFFFSVTELVCDILFTHLRDSFGDHLYVFFVRDFFGGKDKKTIILEIIQV